MKSESKILAWGIMSSVAGVICGGALVMGIEAISLRPESRPGSFNATVAQHGTGQDDSPTPTPWAKGGPAVTFPPKPTASPTPDANAATIEALRSDLTKVVNGTNKALNQLNAVNDAQNLAIGKIIKAFAPSGVIDDGTTYTLHSGPMGGFELKKREAGK